jgi:hypothetical protein
MTRGLRTALACIAAVLLLCMLILLFRGPSFSTTGYDQPAITVKCGSVLTVGWPSDGSYVNEDGSFTVWGDSVEGGAEGLPAGAREGFHRDCSERRDTYLGLALLLAVPGTILASAALAASVAGAGPRRRDQDPPA